MGKQRRKFTTGFKQQVVTDVESGVMSLSEAARRHQVSAGVINRWRAKFREGGLMDSPSVRERALEKENRELKEKLGELYLQVEHLKKLEDWTRRRRSVNTSVVTAKSLAASGRGAE